MQYVTRNIQSEHPLHPDSSLQQLVALPLRMHALDAAAVGRSLLAPGKAMLTHDATAATADRPFKE